MREEGLEIDIKKKSIKGYLMKPGKPLMERIKEQFEELRKLFD